jgi:hypothetical protein
MGPAILPGESVPQTVGAGKKVEQRVHKKPRSAARIKAGVLWVIVDREGAKEWIVTQSLR